jgi:ABC-type Fe3+/spermidine/putrescine transport system ATPase subunit
MVTHDQQEAMSLADRIVVMANGEILQTGTPEALYSTPRNKFVADFIGKNNLLDGIVVAAKPGLCTVRVADAFDVEVPAPSGAPVGQNVEVCVRPQQLRVANASASGLNVVSGDVEARRFLGNVIYYSIRLPNRALLLVESSTAGPVVNEGERVTIGWKPEAGLLFVDGVCSAAQVGMATGSAELQ